MIDEIYNHEEWFLAQLYKLLYQVWFQIIDYCKQFYNISEFITFNQLKETLARRKI